MHPFGTFAPSRFDQAVVAATSRMPCNWIGQRLAILLRRAVTMRLDQDGALDVERWGLRMRLHPRDNGCEKNLLFTPQMYERTELRVLADALRGKPATFIDIGANVGLFSLYAASVAPHTRIIAIEPEPENLDRLRFNLQANPGLAIRVIGIALGDSCGEVGVERTGPDRGGTRTVPINGSDQTIVRCLTLLQVLRQENVASIDALKIDVEGCEDAILVPFFRDAPQSLWPRVIIIEDARGSWRVDLFAKLAELGYVGQTRTRLNLILRR